MFGSLSVPIPARWCCFCRLKWSLLAYLAVCLVQYDRITRGRTLDPKLQEEKDELTAKYEA
jgi:hypothetical protein